VSLFFFQNKETDMVEKVVATPAALELIEFLKTKHGPRLMFHQSGGCCDNSAANCYLLGEITMGEGDVFLGVIGGCEFYMSKSQYATWRHRRDRRPRRHLLA